MAPSDSISTLCIPINSPYYEIDPSRVDRAGTAEDDVYVRLLVLIAAIAVLGRVRTTSPWSGELSTIHRLQKRLKIKKEKFSFHNELNAIPSNRQNALISPIRIPFYFSHPIIPHTSWSNIWRFHFWRISMRHSNASISETIASAGCWVLIHWKWSKKTRNCANTFNANTPTKRWRNTTSTNTAMSIPNRFFYVLYVFSVREISS